MVKATDQQGKMEMRNRSEMIREALRYYLARVPTDEATQAEIAAFRRGKREVASGAFVTLDQLKHDMDSHRHQDRAKATR